MANGDNDKKRHFLFEGKAATEPYTSPPSRDGNNAGVPSRNRDQHGAALQSQIDLLKTEATRAREVQTDAGVDDGFGLQIEFESFPDVELAFERLNRERAGIELLNVRHGENVTQVTVFVPDGKLTELERLIEDYLAHKTTRRGIPRDNQPLIDAIREIRAASVRALWTDDDSVFPGNDDDVLWWEVWLSVRDDRNGIAQRFHDLAVGCGIEMAPGRVDFPERTVVLVRASLARMQRSMLTLNMIAELRRAKETAEFFDSLPPDEQIDWVTEALDRTEYPDTEANPPYACILGTGTNRAHPLISPALDPADLHTVEPAWDVNDQDSHGTAMAGLTLFGDLTPVLAGDGAVTIRHRLESVKLLDHNGGNVGDARFHSYLTEQAVYRPEITAQNRQRIFAMMITARDNRDRGRPSAWSATLDRLASDADGQGGNPRLFVVAAGNINELEALAQYPDSNSTDAIHDPAQAWNVLSIGACTRLTHISEDGDFEPIAPSGGLSPFSTTSTTWDSNRLLKPDVVFEGGNAAKDAYGATVPNSLMLLTTHHQPFDRLLTTANATSAATALAAHMSAEVRAAYPNLWAETVRALIVHSAAWTESMKAMFLPSNGKPKKRDYAYLVRHCGFGVPDIERALWSAGNSLTLIAQDRIQPFNKPAGKDPKLCEMNLHQLPWPLDALRDLGETEIEMRVTLSYFIEPNPSARGVSARYRYESHGLRFDVKRPLEEVDEFRARINVRARDLDDTGRGDSNDPNWLIGTNERHKGSLHSDIWQGSASDLAERGVLAIYPVAGWWKTRKKLGRYNNRVRYALLVSIHAPDVDVDLYTPVANSIAPDLAIEV